MDFIPSAHQAAGHDGCMTAGPVFAKKTSPQEIAFYAETTRRLSADPHLGDLLGSHLAHWMPTYMGTMAEGFHSVAGAMVLNPEGVRSTDSSGDFSETGKDGSVTGEVSRSDKHVTRTDKSTARTDVSRAMEASPQSSYLVLSNLYHGFSHPCILDIKLGSVLTDDTVSAEKAARLAAVSKKTTSGSLAFRICGMKVYTPSPLDAPSLFPNMVETMHTEPAGDQAVYTSFDKIFGRSLTKHNVAGGLEIFFNRIPFRKALLTRFHQRLQVLYNCLLDTEVRIKSGSLLFIYEGDPARWASIDDEDAYFEADPLVCDPLDTTDEDDQDDQDDSDEGSGSETEGHPANKATPLSRLNLIDFAHAKYSDGEGPDDNIIDGVENLIRIFDQMVSST